MSYNEINIAEKRECLALSIGKASFFYYNCFQYYSMHYIKYAFLFIIFISCRSTRKNNFFQPLTTFKLDSMSIQQFDNPSIFFYDLGGLSLFNFTIDAKGRSVRFANKQPAMVYCSSEKAIVYPGEQIVLKLSKNNEPVFEVLNDHSRTSEINFLRAFQNEIQKERPLFQARNKEYAIDSILEFEKDLQAKLPGFITKGRLLFDSLATAFGIGEHFRSLAEAFYAVEMRSPMFNFYFDYRTDLIKKGLLANKLFELLPQYNNIRSQQEIDFGSNNEIRYLEDVLVKIKRREITNNNKVKDAMDSIEQKFRHLAKDFLLTDLLYDAINKRIKISKRTLRHYHQICDDVEYKNIIDNTYFNLKQNSKKSPSKTDNRIISIADSKVYTLDEIIQRNQGLILVLDFWASWCSPCIQQIPFSEKLSHEFSSDKVKFIYLSTDRRNIDWRKKSEDLALDSTNSYIFENFERQSFLDKYKVSEIPRYILIDQNGQIIDANAPKPENADLKKLIETHLKN